MELKTYGYRKGFKRRIRIDDANPVHVVERYLKKRKEKKQ